MFPTDIKNDWRLHYYDGHDIYGSAVLGIMDIANTLLTRGDDVPDDWSYSPGAGGPHPVECQLLDWADYKSDDLIEFVESYLYPLYDFCKRKGLDY